MQALDPGRARCPQARANFLYLMRFGSTESSPRRRFLSVLIILEIALEPLDVAVPFEGQDVGGDAVEEEVIVADDHGAAGKILQCGFERGQSLDIEIVGRLVQQDQVGARFQHLGEVHAVPLAARELADLLLLVGALEIEPADIGARRHLAGPELDHVAAAGDLLEHGLLAVERIARLIDIAELHGVADADGAVIGLVLADDHAEQRGLAGAVRADHADDAAARQLEGETVDQ